MAKQEPHSPPSSVSHIVPQQPRQQQQAATPASSTATACSPRSTAKHRPAPLTLRSSFGYTETTTADLKQRICDARTANPPTTTTQVPLDQRDPLPPTPTTPFAMGNKPSSISGSPVPDDKSIRSVMRRDSKMPMSRKSSFNLFKRIDSKSPLPRDVTASVMSILHRDGHKKEDTTATDDDGQVSVPTDPFYDQHDYDDCSRYPDVCSKVHSNSNMTMTEDRATMPLSAATTIRDCKSADLPDSQTDSQTDGAADFKDVPPVPTDDAHVLSALSPTIPAPSPLPEDSPHKYGLRDKIDTPEVPEEPEKINVAKMRRKSSGLEIFNVRCSIHRAPRSNADSEQEARSLQTAKSFLNGLSTARRRAESASALRPETDFSDSGYGTATIGPSRPGSARPSSTRPSATFQEGEGRRKGHNFKSSGFAYSRPLTLAQMKCYRGHGRLLQSRNKHAPVECAVCHIDDDAEHFSCSWCALRMCRYCRKDFAARGIVALRERVRKAELGGAKDSAHSSSSESLPLRKSKSAMFA